MKYGVTYIIDSGEHEEFQWFIPYWGRNGRRIEGPIIWGDDLEVKFRQENPGEVPEMVIYPDGYENKIFAILKLNFSDPKKPEFELVQSKNLYVSYSPPWDKYYKTGPDMDYPPSPKEQPVPTTADDTKEN